MPRRRFYYSSWKISPTELLSWLNKKKIQTNRYQEYIYQNVSVAGDPRRSKDAIQDIFHKVAQLKKDWGLPKRLSLDEFARRKGQGKFGCSYFDHSLKIFLW